mgnify:CR=1 FL=1
MFNPRVRPEHLLPGRRACRAESLERERLLPSDIGIAGALLLPPIEWMPGAPIGDAEWSAQNRKINDLLSGRTT